MSDLLAMRVVMLTTSWPRDDGDYAGRFLVEQVRRLEAAGCSVQVLAPGRGFSDFGLAYGDGVVANAKRRPWRLPLMLASILRALRRAARDADVIHAHWLLLGPLAALGGRPLALTMHGSGTAGAFADLALAERRPRLFRWLVRRADVIVGVSEPLVQAARKAGATAVLVPHGIEIPPEREEPAGTPVVLFAGRLSPEKGVDVLVEATKGIDDIELVVAGDGPQRDLVPGALGFVPHHDLQALYRRAAMLVVPSRSEGFGMVALEAMSHGVPVVATSVGGLRWLVEDGETGLVVAPGDAPALRRAIERLRDDPQLRRRLGSRARARASERFEWSTITAALLDAYRTAIGA